MRKNIYRFLMALVIALTSIAFTSCGPDELPEVIASEVFGQGMEETITETPESELEGAEIAAELSYKSWILVKGETRGSFEEKVEVTLTNVFNNTETMVEVDDFNLGEYTTSLSSKIRKTREEGFVDIVDTVLIYTVDFEDFSYDFEIEYEVATYDDGVTKQLMPYHRLGVIRDKGITSFQELDFIVDNDDAVYLRMLLTHKISVEFCGKTYDLVANVELRRYVGQHPCVVKSVNTDANVCFTGNEIVSTLVMERTWSDGSFEKEDVVCRMPLYLEPLVIDGVKISGYNDDLEIISYGVADGESELRYDDDFVKIYHYNHTYYVNYNYFTLNMGFVKGMAYYNDGIFEREFPNLEVESFANAEPIVRFLNDGSDENGDYSVYMLEQTVIGKISNTTFECTGTKEFAVYK